MNINIALIVSRGGQKIKILGKDKEIVVDLPTLWLGFEILNLLGKNTKQAIQQLHRILSTADLHLVVKHKGYTIAQMDNRQRVSFLSYFLGLTPINLKPFRLLISLISSR